MLMLARVWGSVSIHLADRDPNESWLPVKPAEACAPTDSLSSVNLVSTCYALMAVIKCCVWMAHLAAPIRPSPCLTSDWFLHL